MVSKCEISILAIGGMGQKVGEIVLEVFDDII